MKWSLLRRIEHYLKRSGTRPTRFGLDVVGDPQLVFQMRKGRVVRPLLEAKILDHLDRVDPDSRHRRRRRLSR